MSTLGSFANLLQPNGQHFWILDLVTGEERACAYCDLPHTPENEETECRAELIAIEPD